MILESVIFGLMLVGFFLYLSGRRHGDHEFMRFKKQYEKEGAYRLSELHEKGLLNDKGKDVYLKLLRGEMK